MGLCRCVCARARTHVVLSSHAGFLFLSLADVGSPSRPQNGAFSVSPPHQDPSRQLLIY